MDFREMAKDLLESNASMRLVLFRGLPGAGKSTAAKKLKEAIEEIKGWHSCNIFENDDFFMLNGTYRYNKDMQDDAERLCKGLAAKSMFETSNVVIVANCFLNDNAMIPYINMAKRMGSNVLIITLTTSFGSVHGEIRRLKKMKDEFMSGEDSIDKLNMHQDGSGKYPYQCLKVPKYPESGFSHAFAVFQKS